MKVYEPLVAGSQVDAGKIMADLRMLAEDTEALLNATAHQTGRRVAAVRAKADESLLAAKARISDLQKVALAKTRAAGSATDGYVHANPWQVMAISAAAGLVIGAMLARGVRRIPAIPQDPEDEGG